MHFFKEFPKEKFNYNGRYSLEIIDITTRIKLLDYVKNHKNLSEVGIRVDYEVFPGQRPEEISYNLYDTYDYTWTILILNDVYSVHEDWIQPNDLIEERLIREYGSIDNANRIPAAHYSEFGYEIDESSKAKISANFNRRENNYVLLEQQKFLTDEYQKNVDDTWMKKLIEIDKNRIASKTETGRVVKEKGPSEESVYKRAMRENDEKRFIRVFEPRVIFSIYSEFSSMIEK